MNIQTHTSKEGWFYSWYEDETGTRIKHNENGPAVTEPGDGRKWYFIRDNYHRLDGPAFEYPPYSCIYYINNRPYSKEQYDKHPDVVRFKLLKQNPNLTENEINQIIETLDI